MWTSQAGPAVPRLRGTQGVRLAPEPACATGAPAFVVFPAVLVARPYCREMRLVQHSDVPAPFSMGGSIIGGLLILVVVFYAFPLRPEQCQGSDMIFSAQVEKAYHCDNCGRG